MKRRVMWLGTKESRCHGHGVAMREAPADRNERCLIGFQLETVNSIAFVSSLALLYTGCSRGSIYHLGQMFELQKVFKI